MHHRFLRLVLLPAVLLNIVVYFIAATVPQPQAALAHAYVIGSDPVDGSTVSTVPKVVRIFFNTSISSLSTASISYVQNGDFVTVQTHSTVSASDSRELDIPLPASLPQGSYFVRWTAISNDDGHTTYGSIGFNAGYSTTGVAGEPLLGPSSSNDIEGVRTLDLLGTLAVAWEWLVLVALTFWIGILVTEQLILFRVERATALLDRAKRQALPLQWLCLAALFVGEIVTLLLRDVHITRALNDGVLDFSALFPLLTQTLYGHLWLLRLLFIILAFALLWRTNRLQSEKPEPPSQLVTRSGPLRLEQERTTSGSARLLKQATEVEDSSTATASTPSPLPLSSPSQRYTLAWLILAGLIVATYALTSNAAQVAQLHASAIVFDGLSLMAQGIWFGGLAYLGYVLLPLLSVVDRASSTEALVTFLRRFTPFILGAIGIELLSLLFLSEATISTLQQLLNDPYGRAFLVRLVLVALVLLASLYTLFVLRTKLTRQAVLLPVVHAELPARRTRQSALEQTERRLRRVVSAQALLGAGILLCAALMFFYAPPIVFPNVSYTNPAASTSSTGIIQTQQVNGLAVTMLVFPGRVNSANTVVLLLHESNGTPITNAKVQLRTNMEAMNMGTAHENATGGNSAYVATFGKAEAFSMSGLWDVDVLIQRPGQAAVQTTFHITLGG